jgi:hypothetical protein
MVAGIFEKSKRLRKAFFFIVKKLPMSGAAVRCDYPRNVGRPLRRAALRRCCEPVYAGKHDGAPAGTVDPADAMQGVSPILICIFRASFLRPFPFRLPTEQCPSFPAGLARD